MKKIFSAPIGMPVHNLKNVLEARGIACEVRGDHLRAGVGDIPPNEAWVELWIVDDSQLEAAREILQQESRRGGGEPWTCPQCGNCQADRPA